MPFPTKHECLWWDFFAIKYDLGLGKIWMPWVTISHSDYSTVNYMSKNTQPPPISLQWSRRKHTQYNYGSLLAVIKFTFSKCTQTFQTFHNVKLHNIYSRLLAILYPIINLSLGYHYSIKISCSQILMYHSFWKVPWMLVNVSETSHSKIIMHQWVLQVVHLIRAYSYVPIVSFDVSFFNVHDLVL